MANNSVPFEIIGAPFTLWVAAVGTEFPDPDETPGGAWTKIGTSGDLNYSREGVTVEHSQTTNPFRPVGDTGPRKIFRQDEDLKVRLQLADMSIEQYAIALNHNTVTDTPPGAGTVGKRKVGLTRGTQMATRALLVRGPSPYDDDMHMQYEVPRAVQTGSPSVVHTLANASLLALEWTALVDEDAASDDERFGRLVAQDAEAGT